MLVDGKNVSAAVSRWGAQSGIVRGLIPVLSWTRYLTSATELVRIRHALVLYVGEHQEFDWTPDSYPKNFLLERGPVDPLFVDLAYRLRLASFPTDWERVTAISAHLLGSAASLVGGPIHCDLRKTYRRIVERGEGYCSDFVRTFAAIALAAEMPVRFWAFSFDGFGGHGHVWLEVWNRDVKKWQLVDIFHNYYFAKADGTPLSALEFRGAMGDSPRSVSLLPLHPSARPGYQIADKAWDYFVRGEPQWYFWLGNNVFTFDQTLSVPAFPTFGRSVGEMRAILQGVHPQLQVLKTPENRIEVEALVRLREHILRAGVLTVLGFIVRGTSMLGSLRARKTSDRKR